MDPTIRGRRFGSFLAGATILVLTLLLIGVAALLSVAAPSQNTLNGTHISVVVLAVGAIVLLLAAFGLATFVYGESYLATLWALRPSCRA